MNILHLTPDFNYSDGRSYYVYLILKYLKRSGHNVFLYTNEGDSFDRLKESGIPVFINPSLSKRSSLVKSLKSISSVVEKYNINIIHSYHRYYELLANSVGRKNKCHTFFTSLSIVDKRYFVEYKSDRIIAVSNCIREMLTKRFGVKESKISLIPNFVDSEEVNRKSSIVNRQSSIVNRESSIVDRDLNHTDNKIYILSIGRFHKDKNFETLIKAIALLKDYKLKLILIGDGGEKSKYEGMIKENSIEAELVPPQRDLKRFFEIADMCILTSVRDPLPGFMLQSGLHCKPFIGSNTDGIPEIINDGMNGLLFEKKNEIELSERIKLYVKDRSLARKCAENLNKLVHEKYTEKSVIPELEKLYSDF